MNLAERLAAARGETLPAPAEHTGVTAVDVLPYDQDPVELSEAGLPGTGEELVADDSAADLEAPVFTAAAPADPAPRVQAGKFDALAGLKQRVKQELLDRIGSRQSDSSLSDKQIKDFATKELPASSPRRRCRCPPRSGSG